MAIIKHVSSKNASYSQVIDYLKYEHDEKTGRVILDENGEKLMRENCLVSSMNCNADTWAIECMEANKKYNQNLSKGDVKNHSYIISFSPEDKERGLTNEKALQMGEEFAKKNFSGHQTIIYTHEDGHNKSGNIHVHIVINSVRISEMEKQDYMTKKCDYAEGLKHRDSAKFRYAYSQDIMRMCERENLHQVDLTKSKTGINDKEYYVNKRGQEKENKLAEKEGRTPTVFDTDKEEIRQVLTEAKFKTEGIKQEAEREKAIVQYAKENYGVEITESRGRWSYSHPSWDGTEGKRAKPIKDSSLGEEFRKECIIKNGIDKQVERTDGKGNIRTGTAGSGSGIDTGKFDNEIRTQQLARADIIAESRMRELAKLQEAERQSKERERGNLEKVKERGERTR